MAREVAGAAGLGFWQGKTPCWEMCHCPEGIKDTCPAPKYITYPCWEIEGTYLKLADDGNRGNDTSICEVCRVFKRYGYGKPVQLRLCGKGIDSYLRNLKRSTEATEPDSTAQRQRDGRTPGS